MRIRVLFFGRLKEITGCAEDWAEIAEGSRVEELFARYGRRFPALAGFRKSLVASVNEEFADWQAELRGGDEVAFLPPVSGGAATDARDLYEIVRQPIGAAEIVAAMKSPGDGAVVVFDGIVRNHTRGRETLYLDYEAYEAMALKKMREIGEEAHRKFTLDRIAIVHRLGRLEIGESSVFIAVSAPHRSAAFDACRFAIDTLKRNVPIWKKEFFRDGAVWVEGEIPGKPSTTPGESTP